MDLLHSCKVLYQCLGAGAQNSISPIEKAALVWEDSHIVWVGRESELPEKYRTATQHDAGGAIVTPGLIDCHTHLCFAGWRAEEFELRILGKSYLEIAECGGGIMATVEKTRTASKTQLVERASHHLKNYAELGITTIEAKSGYGLNLKDELKILEVYEELRTCSALEIHATFLGAHTIPKEYKATPDRYVDLVCNEMLPEVARRKLATFCDVFLEKGAFTTAQARRILETGQTLGLRSKLHADQLSDSSGAELAAELHAISADHLEWISPVGIEKMVAADVVAVMLPLAALYTNSRSLNARALLDAGAKVAIATDFNPGTAPSYHLPWVMSLACVCNRMTPKEVLKGVTILAAKAIGEDARIGSLEVGKQADFALFSAASVDEWIYHPRPNCCKMTFKKGVRIF